MVLLPCRECGKQVSSEAASCPDCGVPDPTRLEDVDDSEAAQKLERIVEGGSAYARHIEAALLARRTADMIVGELVEKGVSSFDAREMVFAVSNTMGLRAGQISARGNKRREELERRHQEARLVGLAASAILFLGVFMPIVRAPIFGSLNYFQNGRGDGVIIILLVVASLVMIAIENYKPLIYTGTASILVLFFTFVMLRSRLSSIEAELAAELRDNPFRGIGEAMAQSIQLQWGWALLVLGAAALIYAGVRGQDV